MHSQTIFWLPLLLSPALLQAFSCATIDYTSSSPHLKGSPHIRISRRWGQQYDGNRRMMLLRASATDDLPEVSSMRLGDIRQELESYGISTKSFFEKKELVAALEKARAEGIKPKLKKDEPSQTQNRNCDSTAKNASAPSSKEDRSKRIAEEMEKAKAMKVGELKKALQDMKVSTKSMFEKSEFVKAYAEAMVDGVRKQTASSTNTSKEEPRDPSYRDVAIQKMPRGDPRLLQGVVIDVTAR